MANSKSPLDPNNRTKDVKEDQKPTRSAQKAYLRKLANLSSRTPERTKSLQICSKMPKSQKPKNLPLTTTLAYQSPLQLRRGRNRMKAKRKKLRRNMKEKLPRK